MNRLLLIISAFLSAIVSAQPIVTDVTNKQILKWDSTFTVESKFFRADYDYETRYYSSVKKENNLVAEYFRHDDTSFLFVKYDTSERKLQRGLIRFCREIFDSATVQIPDYNSDPDGSKSIFKDTIVYECSYRKDGVWWERDSVGMIWKGNYRNGLREGKWEEGILVCCNETSERVNDAMYDLIRPFLSHMYKKGNEVDQFKDSLFWPKIKGGWYYHHNLKPNRLVFEKITGSKDLNFISPEKVTLEKTLVKDHKGIARNYFTSQWVQQANLLAISNEQIDIKFRVLRLDDFYLIVERLN